MVENLFFVGNYNLLLAIENNEKVCICKDKSLVKLLNNELNFKTHKDDIYLFLPFTTEDKDAAVNSLFDSSVHGERENVQVKNQDSEIPHFLMEELKSCIDYECEDSVAEEIETVYLGAFDFLHTNDLYEGDVVGEEKIHCLLTAHKKTSLYILTMIFTDSKFCTTQIEDQFSYNYLKIKNPDGGDYINIENYLENRYDLISCGKGKILVCMSNKPENPEEFRHIMAAEVFNGLEQEYTFSCNGEIAKNWCETDCTHYNSYSIFLSNLVIAFIPDAFDSNAKNRIEQMATYAFIAILAMFQNTSIVRINKKIAKALSYEGRISNKDVLEVYKEFGKTARFWESHTYRYAGAQLEAECIVKAFGNAELVAECERQQEFLEKIVNLQAAKSAKRSGFFLNIMAVIIAVYQLKDFVIDIIKKFYNWVNAERSYPELTQTNMDKAYYLILIGCFALFFVVRRILRDKQNRIQKKIFTHKKRDK